MEYRTHNCGELRLCDVGLEVTLSGWSFRIRVYGAIMFIDIRDVYGVTQLVFENEKTLLFEEAKQIGREYVIRVKGFVRERSNKNPKIPTGDIEILVKEIEILNTSEVPPFTLENETDGGDEHRLKYRYLDLRRECLKKNIILRHNIAQEVRNYLNNNGFFEIETPFLIKSTPEGARDFIVPSRMNTGTFYALPQSPQTFKQLLMVSGFDKYYQIVRCFRDEDLRADRQPEFTQIDCEMSFVNRDDILYVFEGLIKHVFKQIKNITLHHIERITYDEALNYYGTDKPDLRFDMKIHDITCIAKGRNFQIFDSAEFVCALCIPEGASFSRKQIGADGLVWVKWDSNGRFKSSVDKFYSEEDFMKWMGACGGQKNDMLVILSGIKTKTLKVCGDLRLKLGDNLGLRDNNKYKACWVLDFPLLT